MMAQEYTDYYISIGYSGVTISVYDMAQLDDVASAVKAFGSAQASTMSTYYRAYKTLQAGDPGPEQPGGPGHVRAERHRQRGHRGRRRQGRGPGRRHGGPGGHHIRVAHGRRHGRERPRDMVPDQVGDLLLGRQLRGDVQGAAVRRRVELGGLPGLVLQQGMSPGRSAQTLCKTLTSPFSEGIWATGSRRMIRISRRARR